MISGEKKSKTSSSFELRSPRGNANSKKERKKERKKHAVSWIEHVE
jgi:hypothetical protein